MKFESDKSIKIYNEIKILYANEKDISFFEELSIELSKFYQNKKVFWFFYSKKLCLTKFTSSIVGEVKNSSSLLIFYPSSLNKKQLQYSKNICHLFGKKLIIILKKNNKVKILAKELIEKIKKI
jgi:hypothetical protein